MDRARKDDLVELIDDLAAPRRRRRSSPPTTSSSPPPSPSASSCSATASSSPTAPPPRSSPAAGTSPPRSPGSSTCPAWSPPSRAPPSSTRIRLSRYAKKANQRRGRLMSWQLASFLILGARPARRLRLVRALAAALAGRRPGRRAGRPGDRRADRLRRLPQRQADDRHRHLRRLRARPGARLRGRRPRRAGLQLLVRPGPVDAVADGGLGAVRRPRRGAGARRPQRRSPHPGRGLRFRRHRLRRAAQLLADGDLRRRPLAAALPRAGGARGPLRRRPRDRQRRLRADRRPGDGADAGPLPRALRVADAGAGHGARGPAAGPGRCRSWRRTAAQASPTSAASWLDVRPERRRRLRRLARRPAPAPR